MVQLNKRLLIRFQNIFQANKFMQKLRILCYGDTNSVIRILLIKLIQNAKNLGLYVNLKQKIGIINLFVITTSCTLLISIILNI